MANITKIKAKDPAEPQKSEAPVAEAKKVEEKSAKTDKKAIKEAKKAEKQAKKSAKSGKKPFILFRPFCALGRYLRDSWKEIRQVRWPSRKTTWKMLLAVLVYTAFFVVVITLLDALLTYLFNLIIA